MKNLILKSILSLFILSSSSAYALSNFDKLANIGELTRFAFGSCNKESEEQFAWDKIIEADAQLFLWGGDNIYGDSEPLKDQIAAKYIVQNKVPSYAEMKKTIPLIGTWDDHDFGKDGGGREFLAKVDNRNLALDFLEVPENALVRNRDGIYQSYVFGENEKKVKFILLDNRFNQTPKTLLGDTQWTWLEQELRTSDAKINFIVSGTAVLPGNVIRSDEWADWPAEKTKLLNLLDKYKTPGVVFLTGDKHFSAITRKYGYLEVMSSGLTHVKKGFFVKTYMNLLFERTFFEKNFALVDINWDANPIQLIVDFKGRKNNKKTIFELSNNQFVLKEKVD